MKDVFFTFDSDAAQQFAIVSATRSKIGRPISQIDAQILVANSSIYNSQASVKDRLTSLYTAMESRAIEQY